MTKVTMTVNGKAVSGEVEGRTLLSTFLREGLGLTGTHVGCDTSQCGACVVHVDGTPAGVVLMARRGWTSRVAAMAVVPEFRRQRAGRALMEHVLAEAKQRGDAAQADAAYAAWVRDSCDG